MPYEGLAATFDDAAELYEAIRPTYPPALFADLARYAGPGRVVEIGAGTGKATRGLVEQGWNVTAVEPGPALASVLRRQMPGVQVVEMPFELYAGGSTDLVFCATAWHWLDQSVAFDHAADLLRPGGTLAIVTTEHVLPSDGDRFFVDVEAAYDEVGLGDGKGGPQPPEKIEPPYVQAIRDSGRFGEPEVLRYVWAQNYTVEEYLALLSTYSNHLAASEEQRALLFGRIRELMGERAVRKHYLNLLHVARRASASE